MKCTSHPGELASWLGVGAAALALSACASTAPLPGPAAPIGFRADDVEFQPAPPNMPRGVEIAVLEGDPRRAGTFTLRLHVPAGFSLVPHTHPTEERVTVLEGAVSVGFGEQIDAEKARRYDAGSFYVNPAGRAHYVLSEQGAVIQITGAGPWRVDFVVPPDDVPGATPAS